VGIRILRSLNHYWLLAGRDIVWLKWISSEMRGLSSQVISHYHFEGIRVKYSIHRNANVDNVYAMVDEAQKYGSTRLEDLCHLYVIDGYHHPKSYKRSEGNHTS